MKTNILTYLLLLIVQMGLAQELKPIANRMQNAELVVEGKIVLQHCFWGVEKKMIYTTNEIEVYKTFKGKMESSRIEVITLGGVLEERYVNVSHNLEFSQGQEGIFFLKQHPTDGKFQLRPTQEPVTYHFDGVNVLATDGLKTYKNLVLELYPLLGTYQSIAPNSLEKRQIVWNQTNHLAKFSPKLTGGGGDTGIEYSFENPYFSGAGNQYLEFDIYGRNLGYSGLFGKAEILIDYNPLTFGLNVAASGTITISKGNVILNPDYTLTASDSTSSKLKILIDAPISPTGLYNLTFVSEKFCHVQLDVSNFQIPSALTFDETGMQNRSNAYLNSIYVNIGYVEAKDTLLNTVNAGASAVGIFYSFENLQVTDGSGLSKTVQGGGPQYAEFDIYAWATDPNTSLSKADVYIDYNLLTFDNYIATNGKVTVMDGVIIADTTVYNGIYGDVGNNTFNIRYIPDNPLSGAGYFTLPTSPTQLCHVGIEILACDEPAGLVFNQPLMDDQSLHYTGAAIPNESYSPTVATDVENTVLCPTNGQPVIYSISPKKLSAGKGDILTINGANFGTDSVNRKVWFRNADDTQNWMNAEQCEKVFWNDSLIKVKVPSINGYEERGGSGNILITKGSGSTNAVQSTDTIEVYYSLINKFSLASSSTYRVNLPSDNVNGGFIFQVSPNVSQIPNAKACVDSAMKQWRCLTHVNFTLGNDTAITNNYNTSSIPNDGINHIFFAPSSFWADPNNAPAAQTFEAGDVKSCNDGTNHYIYYVDEIDIAINESAPYPFLFSFTQLPDTNELDFYSIILHELGHAHRLTHVVETYKVMRPYNPKGDYLRLLSLADIDGGIYILTNNELALLDSLFSSCTSQPFPLPMVPATCSTLGIESPFEIENGLLSIYPNPTEGDIKVVFDSRQNTNIVIYLKDILGRNVYEKKLGGNSKGKIEISFDIPKECSQGMYLLSIQTENTISTAKIIFQP